MIGKYLGLIKKYEIVKISNPTKEIDAIVLEFDDPIAREAIAHWAELMKDEGYENLYKEVVDKLDGWIS